MAKALGLSVDEVRKRALIALLNEELRKVRSEKATILVRYGVRSFEELWEKIERDEIDDTVAHDDIVRLDYLEHRERVLRQILEELTGNGKRSMQRH